MGSRRRAADDRWLDPEPSDAQVKEPPPQRLGIAEGAARYHPDVVDEKIAFISNYLKLLPSTHLRAKRVAHAKGMKVGTYYSAIVNERIAADAAELGID